MQENNPLLENGTNVESMKLGLQAQWAVESTYSVHSSRRKKRELGIN